MRTRSLAAPAVVLLAVTLLAAPVAAQTSGGSIVLSKTTVSITEGGVATTYTVQLDRVPLATVSVALTTSVAGQVTIAPAGPLTFTATNYDAPQTVTVLAVDDGTPEGTQAVTVTHRAASTDPNFKGRTATLTASVIDNDLGLVVAHAGTDTSSTIVREGTATTDRDSFIVALGSQPTEPVTVSFSPGPGLSTSLLSVRFDASNWQTARTITVAAVDDSVASGQRTAAIAVTTSSAQTAYNGLSTSLPVTLRDNDVAGIRFLQGSTTLATTNPKLTGNLTEGGASLAYKVRLLSQPTAPVTVAITSETAGQLVATPSTLTFTAADWATPKTVTVAAAHDRVDEGSDTVLATLRLLHDGTSADPVYHTLPAAALRVDVKDDDVSGLVLKQGTTVLGTTGKLTGTAGEGGAPLNYTVALTSQPTAPVTIDLSIGNVRALVRPAVLTFTAANWETPQNVSVTVPNDDVDNGAATQQATITHDVSAGDARYLALANRLLKVNLGDEDVAGVIKVSAEAVPSVSEAGDAYVYTLRLRTEPTGDVTVTPSGSRLLVQPATVTFSAANWSVPQTVRITVANDTAPGLDSSSVLNHAVASTDALYRATAARPPTTTIAIVEDDGVLVIAQSGGSTVVGESGQNDTFTVRLVQNPPSDVTVAVTVPAGSDLRVNGATSATLTFRPASGTSFPNPCPGRLGSDCEWDTLQTVRVTVLDNPAVDGPRLGSVRLVASGGGASFDGRASPPIQVSVLDNDTAGLVFNGLPVGQRPALASSEGGTTTYQVRLASRPTADVRVAVSAGTGATVSPAALTFGPGNWSTARTVNVTATQDSVDRGVKYVVPVFHAVTSGDLQYHQRNPLPINLTVTDNDAAGFRFSAAGQTGLARNVLPQLKVAEGLQTTYTVRLTSQPESDVRVSFGGLAAVSPAQVTFTAANWDQAQTVTVTAPQDAIDQGANHTVAVTQQATSDDPLYKSVPSPLKLNVTDDDTAGFQWETNGTNLVVREGGPATAARIALQSQPTADVTLALTHEGGLTLSRTSLTFTAANWNVKQDVLLTAPDDATPELAFETRVLADAASTDALYNTDAVAGRLVTVRDNDGLLVLTRTGGSNDVAEGGATDTYTVRLVAAPTADVKVIIDDAGDQLTYGGGASSRTLTFRPASRLGLPQACVDASQDDCTWNVPQTVTIAARDDSVAEGPMTVAIQHVLDSADERFDAVPTPALNVSVADNEAAVLVSGTPLSVNEASGTTTYTVRLSSAPTFSVALDLTGTRVTTSPARVLFDSESWSVPKTVTVAAINDDVDQPPSGEVGSIATTVSSADPRFNGIAVATLPVTIVDDDQASLVVVPTGTGNAVAEGGATDSLGVRLATRPIATVTVTVAGDSQVSASRASLTFTPDTWNVLQSFTIVAVNDAVREGAHTGRITLTPGGDARYAALAPTQVTVSVADND